MPDSRNKLQFGLISFIFHSRQEVVTQSMAMETVSAWLENHLKKLSNDFEENTS